MAMTWDLTDVPTVEVADLAAVMRALIDDGRTIGKAHSHTAEPDGRDFQAAFSKFAPLHVSSSYVIARYCSSLTCSIQSTVLPSSAS